MVDLHQVDQFSSPGRRTVMITISAGQFMRIVETGHRAPPSRTSDCRPARRVRHFFDDSSPGRDSRWAGSSRDLTTMRVTREGQRGYPVRSHGRRPWGCATAADPLRSTHLVNRDERHSDPVLAHWMPPTRSVFPSCSTSIRLLRRTWMPARSAIDATCSPSSSSSSWLPSTSMLPIGGSMACIAREERCQIRAVQIDDVTGVADESGCSWASSINHGHRLLDRHQITDMHIADVGDANAVPGRRPDRCGDIDVPVTSTLSDSCRASRRPPVSRFRPRVTNRCRSWARRYLMIVSFVATTCRIQELDVNPTKSPCRLGDACRRPRCSLPGAGIRRGGQLFSKK